MKLPLNREEDIKLRGRNCLVYDYDGSIVILEKAKIWYSHDGNYMEPRDIEEPYYDFFCAIS